tara:strand:+ start:1487 stop:2653 length:1167 start_codon:yes stop_codon:yes gene_type:complete
MHLLESNIQNYHWGDKDFLAQLQGRTPTGKPEAELWMGAHPKSPSRIQGVSLNLKEIIERNPEKTLGERAQDFGNELPFIMKVLAIGNPLSIQVHPSEDQAIQGYTREITLDEQTALDRRSYLSPRGKKEIVCALTNFEAKFGFRPVSDIVKIMTCSTNPEFIGIAETLKTSNSDDDKLRRTVQKILNYSPEQVQTMTLDISKSIKENVISARELEHFRKLIKIYPSDPGLLIFLLLNFVTLRPGEAMYVPPGVTHAYLQGHAIEITSNSDNVLRCGLTSKHIDREEFLSVAEFISHIPTLQIPDSAMYTYESPTKFKLSRLEVQQTWETTVDGAEILFSTEGRFSISNALGETMVAEQGVPVWIPASDQVYTLSGQALIFRCSFTSG